MKLLCLTAYLIYAGDIDLNHVSDILVREVLKVLTMIIRQPYVVDQQADIKGRYCSGRPLPSCFVSVGKVNDSVLRLHVVLLSHLLCGCNEL